MSGIITTGSSPTAHYDQLLASIDQTLQRGRNQVAYAVSHTILQTYWEVGKQIVEYEQQGNEKAEYGSELLKRLSRGLTIQHGDGFGMSNMNKMRRLYICYPILQTLSAKLTWSHYVKLLKPDDPLECSFYEGSAGRLNGRQWAGYDE